MGFHFVFFLLFLVSCQSDSGAQKGFMYDEVVESDDSVMTRRLLRAASAEAVNTNVDLLSN